MPAVVVEADVIDVAAWRWQVSEILLRIHVFQRHHVDGADQMPFVVIGEERTFRQCFWVDIERAETGSEGRKLDEHTYLLIGRSRRLIENAGRGSRQCHEHRGDED